jgi:hypothetical protein
MNSQSRFTLLTRHFFRRFLDNDLISPNGDSHVGLSQALAALLSPSLLVAFVVLFKYGMMWRPRWERVLHLSVADGLLYISLSMAVVGVAAAVSWDAFFLDARDRYILSILPVPERLLSAAKLAAFGLFLAFVVAGVNAFPAFVVPAIMVQGLRGANSEGHFLALTVAQALAPGLAGAWTVLAVVSLRGLLAILLPAGLFQRVGSVVQALLMLGFLAFVISLSSFIDSVPGVLAAGGPARDLSPPLWFLGLYQSIVGNPDPVYAPLARTAGLAFAGTTLLTLLVFFAPRQRRAEHLAGATTGGALRTLLSALRRLSARLLLRHPLGRASFSFMLTTMGRSAKHRIYLAGALGAGLAWAATGLVLEFARSGRAAFGTTVPTTPALQAQLVLALFLIVAARFGVLVPATLPANWLFRLTERRPVAPYFAGARRAALLLGLIPIAACAPASVALFGWSAGAYHAAVGLLYAVFIVELFFNSLAKVPCTATYVSGQLKLKSRVGYYLFGAMALTGVPSWLEALTFRGRVGPLTLPLLLAVPAGLLAFSRWRKERALPGLIFDDSDEESMQTLGLTL